MVSDILADTALMNKSMFIMHLRKALYLFHDGCSKVRGTLKMLYYMFQIIY